MPNDKTHVTCLQLKLTKFQKISNSDIIDQKSSQM